MRILFIVITCVILAGCAKDVWDKSGETQADFNQDQGACQMYVLGMPQYAPQQSPPVYVAQTTYMGNTATTTIQPQQSTNQSIADLSAAIGNVARKKLAMRACMMSKGYSLESNSR